MRLKLLVAMVYLIPFFLVAKQQTVVGCFSSGRINVKLIQIADRNVVLAY